MSNERGQAAVLILVTGFIVIMVLVVLYANGTLTQIEKPIWDALKSMM